MIADKLAMAGTEKNIAFDATGELVAAPGGRKTPPAEPEPENVAESDPETTGSDIQTTDDGTTPQANLAETQEPSDNGRPAWASGNY